MSEWKTLKELASVTGFPFDAVSEHRYSLHCLGITPKGQAVGWGHDGYNAVWDSELSSWKLAPKKKIVYECLARDDMDGAFAIDLFESLDAAKKPGPWKFIKVLREIEVEG